MSINLSKKELNIIKYLASLKVDSPQYADVNQELTTILKKIAKVLDKSAIVCYPGYIEFKRKRKNDKNS